MGNRGATSPFGVSGNSNSSNNILPEELIDIIVEYSEEKRLGTLYDLEEFGTIFISNKRELIKILLKIL